MTNLKAVVLGMSGLVFSGYALAQAPISDLGQRYDSAPVESYESAYPQSSGAYPAQNYDSDVGSATAGGQASSGSAGVLNTVNQLQEEVANLRGQVEELTYQVERLKQQQMEDYSRLDQMIAAGGASAASAAASATDGAIDASQTPSAPRSNLTTDGKAEYEAAYALLKQKKFSEAEVGFNTLISTYPNSTYSGNANFWLGFIYQTRGDLTASEKAFKEVLKFPNHNKQEDAKYNLGKVYHLQGKTDEARKLLTEVAAGSSNTASLAKAYLATM